MALDAQCLGESIVDAIERFNALQPDTQVGVTVRQVPKEDGTLDTVVEPIMGRPPFNRAGVEPLAYAIANAVVEHLTSHADIIDNGTVITPAGTWRIQ